LFTTLITHAPACAFFLHHSLPPSLSHTHSLTLSLSQSLKYNLADPKNSELRRAVLSQDLCALNSMINTCASSESCANIGFCAGNFSMLARFAKTLVSMTAEQLADSHKKVQRDLLFGCCVWGCCVWGCGCGLVSGVVVHIYSSVCLHIISCCRFCRYDNVLCMKTNINT